MTVITIRAAPPPPVPDAVSSRRFKMQLEIDGLTTSVEAWIATQPKLVQIAYVESKAFNRDDTMLQSGFAALGYSSQRVDAFFTAASKL
ncbi:hypothetical protein N7E70_021075 [Aminobacter sp. NyZ550]|uniref:Uncharacterized protein n=1 Tax=Aminobacter ciceronei TaxID=150723 RepID=A0ABR6C2M6_9HYPH|nr:MULTISPECIES: hypothetical protein [Aminobacter]MBA8905498.1 hypothetical protein [Aminobacter ciceronei]MBA9019203.1 hypothetical protein [Aminobacter ciceronei]WAX94146.1 hypothetical protein N7E70_021075 [Aminobacter sp. NyZ550]